MKTKTIIKLNEFHGGARAGGKLAGVHAEHVSKRLVEYAVKGTDCQCGGCYVIRCQVCDQSPDNCECGAQRPIGTLQGKL